MLNVTGKYIYIPNVTVCFEFKKKIGYDEFLTCEKILSYMLEGKSLSKYSL